VEEAIIYDLASALVGEVAFIPGTTELFLWRPGFYLVKTGVHHTEPCQFSIMKNDIFVVPGGIFASPTGATQSTTCTIVELTNADMMTETALSPSGFACKLQVKNHTSYVPLVTMDGTSGAGSAQPDTSAYLTVVLLYPSPVLPPLP
jgi:hypothetical protein